MVRGRDRCCQLERWKGWLLGLRRFRTAATIALHLVCGVLHHDVALRQSRHRTLIMRRRHRHSRNPLPLNGLPDLLLKPTNQPPPSPRLHSNLKYDKQQHIDAHQAPGAPSAHPPNLIAPDLLLVVPREDAPAQVCSRLLGGPLRHGQRLGGPRLGLLVRVVGPVQGREALEVGRGPGVLPLEQLVDLALRGGPLRDRGRVGLFGGPDGGARSLRERFLRFDAALERLDPGIAR